MTMHSTQPGTASAANPSPSRAGAPRDGHADRMTGRRRLQRRVERRGLIAYTLAAYTISWTLLVGGFFGSQVGLLNAEGTLIGVMIQVAAAGPLIAALLVVSLSRGRSGLAAFGRSLIQWRVHPGWYALTFLGIPTIMVATMSVLHPTDIPAALATTGPQLLTQFPLMVLSVALVTGLAEEPGWRGYAQPTANRRYRPVVAALLVSVIWALWHLPNALFGQSMTETALHLLATTVNGLVLAWAYNATRGSVLIVMLLHGAQNATAGLVLHTLDAAGAVSRSEYYASSAVTFGVLMVIVVLTTRGRLGLRPTTPGTPR